MPGQIKSVAVKPGDKVPHSLPADCGTDDSYYLCLCQVVVGQELLVIEAMKMQNILRSDRDTIISEVRVKEGQSVSVDEVLLAYKDSC